jgi:hypothetical protein
MPKPTKPLLFSVVFWLLSLSVFAQPVNDHCSGAIKIPFGSDDYQLGTFSSAKADLTGSGIDAGESVTQDFVLAGINRKTVWYYFDVPTARSISITLRQKDSGIAQNDVGMEVFKSNGCYPNLGEISTNLVPIQKFGQVSNTCVSPGRYYVQVCARNSANDNIWLDIDVQNPSPAKYDNFNTPLYLGNLGESISEIDFGCLSVEDKAEINPLLGPEYSQTAWVVFTTDKDPQQIDIRA